MILCVIDKLALVSSCVLVLTFSSSKLIVLFLNWFTLSARASPIVEGKKSSEKAGMDWIIILTKKSSWKLLEVK